MDSGGSDKSQFFHGAGCNFCAQTGFLDRIGLYVRGDDGAWTTEQDFALKGG